MNDTHRLSRELFLNKACDWGQVICIHNGPSYYFDKYIIMSGKTTPKRSHSESFKTLYIEKGLGKLHYKSKLKNVTEAMEIQDGFKINILPNDIFSIECYQDIFMFETGTVRKKDEVIC